MSACAERVAGSAGAADRRRKRRTMDRERRRALSCEAEQMLRRRSNHSLVLDSDDEDSVPRVSCKDLVEGDLLGMGSFNNVYAVHLALPDGGGLDHDITARLEDPFCADSISTTSSTAIVSDADADPSGHGQYAYKNIGKRLPGGYVVKYLRPSIMKDLKTLRTGAVDLAYEGKLLSGLCHDNIIKIRGVSANSLAGAIMSDDDRGYFIILDQVHCTLQDKLSVWKDQSSLAEDERRNCDGQRGRHLVRQVSSLIRLSNDSTKTLGLNEETRHLTTRLKLAAGIARGLEYLHKQNIIYRDLKPSNIGIAFDGTVKILDFGIAKKINPENMDQKMTGMSGTLRYMSPETALCSSYGVSADVYSFGILMQEICSMEKPFADITTVEEFKRRVILGEERPKLRNWWPAIIKMLIVDCWQTEPRLRPRMDQVALLTQAYIDDANNSRNEYTASSTVSKASEKGIPIEVHGPRSRLQEELAGSRSSLKSSFRSLKACVQRRASSS